MNSETQDEKIGMRFRLLILRIGNLMELRTQHAQALKRVSMAIALRMEDSSCPVLKYIGKHQVSVIQVAHSIATLEPQIETEWAELKSYPPVQKALAEGDRSPFATAAFSAWLAGH